MFSHISQLASIRHGDCYRKLLAGRLQFNTSDVPFNCGRLQFHTSDFPSPAQGLVRGRHGFRASVILTLFQGHVEERHKATSSSSTYYGPYAAMHTRSLFVFCCYGCRALSSERVRSQLHHAIVNDHDWLSPVHPGMSCTNVDQCVFYIVLCFHRKLFLHFSFVFVPYACLHTCGSSFMYFRLATCFA